MSELPRAQLAAWAAAAVLAVLAVVRLTGGGPAGEPAPVRVEQGAGGEHEAGGGLYVHVAGQVRRPGLFRLPPSARIAAALERAGGPLRRADLSAVNLAARVQDGQQILVPRIGARPVAAAAAGRGGAGGAAGGKLSLATATLEQLDGLDGIGPTLAKRIVEYRERHGGFRSLDELREVEGIGDKRFAALRDAVGP